MKYFGPEHGIAPWKIDSPFERFLARKADSSEFWKTLYVGYYRIFDRNYFLKGLPMIDKLLNINNNIRIKEGEKKMIRDMIYCLHRYGCEFNEYFTYEFYRLNTSARESFICSKNRWKYYLFFNGKRNNPIFDNKYLTYQKFSKFIRRKYCFVSSIEDRDNFNNFQSGVERYIIKPVGGSGGRGVIIAKNKEYSIDLLIEKYSKGFLAEEILHNHETIAAVNPSSLNTIRVVTIKNVTKTDILFAFMRFGRKGSVVDNAFCGGIICNVDIETGIITSTATELGEKYIVHPDSKIPLIGFRIPLWEEVKALAMQLSQVVPECRYVGWDLAVTNDCVVMVEANCKGEFVNQMATSRGIKDTLEQYMK